MTQEQITLLLTYIHLAAEKAVIAAKTHGYIDWNSLAHIAEELHETTENSQ